MTKDKWVIFHDDNYLDCEIPGLVTDSGDVVENVMHVVGRHYPCPKKPSLTEDHISLLQLTYPSAGLPRWRTSNDGTFIMVGSHQTNTSNSSMAQITGAMEHDYHNERTTNTSLLHFSRPIMNHLSNQALNVQDSSGQIIMGTLKRAFFIKDKLKLDSRDICPYIIYTGPRFHKKKGYYVSFCNNEHDDNDITYGAIGLVVKQYNTWIKSNVPW